MPDRESGGAAARAALPRLFRQLDLRLNDGAGARDQMGSLLPTGVLRPHIRSVIGFV